MDARAKTVREIRPVGDQYITSLFRRLYSRTKTHSDRPRADIQRFEHTDTARQRFPGLMASNPARANAGEAPSFQFTYGQPRLTTLRILLATTGDVAQEKSFTPLAEEICEGDLVQAQEGN